MCIDRYCERLNQLAKFGDLLSRVHARKGNDAKARELTIQSYILRREVAALKANPKAGNIGEPIRHVELPGEEPLTVPEFDPAEEPPVEAPSEAPAVPEPVPA